MDSTTLSSMDSWDAIAADYDKLNRPLMLEFTRKALENVDISPDWRVLDIACGPGTCSLYLSEFVDQVDAVDFSPQMISILKKNIKSEQIENVFPQVADGQNLPFPDEQFNLCISMFGLMFFPNRDKGFREIFRVLKPGGVGVISSWGPADNSNLMQTLGAAMAEGLPESLRQGGQSDMPLSDKEQFAKELTKSGFSSFELFPIYSSFQVGDVDVFWKNAAKSFLPIQLLKKSMDQTQWIDVESKALNYLRHNLKDDSELGSEAFVAVVNKN